MLEEKNKTLNSIYLHGRPCAHPLHEAFAQAVTNESRFVDSPIRWQDKNKGMLFNLFAWFYNAVFFKNKRKYDFFLVDNLHFTPVIMKRLRLIRRRQKIIVHMGSHTLYFIYAHRFSKFSEWMHIRALKGYDAIICEGQMAEWLVKKIITKNLPKIYTVRNGIPKEHFPAKENHTHNLFGKNVLFMGHGPGKNRLWYKGLDLMVSAFELAFEKDNELTFTIVGNWDRDIINSLLSNCKDNTRKAIHFVGETSNLGPYTSQASLYLHCARGEAFGVTVLIAMAAGIPSIVSEWTGAREIVEQVDPRLVVSLDAHKIANEINMYFALTDDEKISISEKCKTNASEYSAERAINVYKETFRSILNDLDLLKYE